MSPGEWLADADVPRIEKDVSRIFDEAWVEDGYVAPNLNVYPWQWLWDSCFHVLVWLALESPERALTELAGVFAFQDEAGFVPHMGYHGSPTSSVELWEREGSSTVTQPPMFGHAVAELERAGVAVPDELKAKAVAGLEFLLRHRARHETGLICAVHPWETGCDDSPRWDHYCPGEGFDLALWRVHKVDLIRSIEHSAGGSPLSNPLFKSAPVSLNALTVFNMDELATVSDVPPDWADLREELVSALTASWDQSRATWVDQGDSANSSGRIRTADALCALFAVDDPAQRAAALAELADPAAFGGAFGPPGVHPDEPMYDPASYWRGPVWPQIAYLLWKALGRGPAETELGEIVRGRTIAGAVRSGYAEYWSASSASGGGAIPQSWTGLALVLAKTRTISPPSSG